MDYHDVLASFGVGSAHPGGFHNTMAWLNAVSMKEDSRVLEVGCGTGRTACYIHGKYGAQVIGIDVRPEMIEKAKARAQAQEMDVLFTQVELDQKFPFPDQSFDFVIAESVTVFNDIEQMLAEYYRLLAEHGQVLDTEMGAAFLLPELLVKEIQELYGASRLPTLSEWKKLFIRSGFSDVRMVLSGSVKEMNADHEVLDDYAVVSPEAFSPSASNIVQHNQRFMRENGKWLTYGVFQGTKK